MRDPLNSFIEQIPPSGIRKFFDLVAEMDDPEVVSLGVGEPDFDTPGISVKRVFTRSQRARPSTAQMPV